jgi:hypothetical protein
MSEINSKLLIEAKKLVADIEAGKEEKYLYPTFVKIKNLIGPNYAMLDPIQRKAFGYMYIYALGTVDIEEKLTYVQGALNILRKAYLDMWGSKNNGFIQIENTIANLDNTMQYADNAGGEPGTGAMVLKAANRALNLISQYAWDGMAVFPDEDLFKIGGQIKKEVKNND